MTAETRIRHDRPNVAIEFDGRTCCACHTRCGQQREDNEARVPGLHSLPYLNRSSGPVRYDAREMNRRIFFKPPSRPRRYWLRKARNIRPLSSAPAGGG